MNEPICSDTVAGAMVIIETNSVEVPPYFLSLYMFTNG